MKLLVEQLKVQDPLNPMDDKEFVAQLSQFSSLEQLTNISTGVSSLATIGNQQVALGAVGFIGKTVKATGDYSVSRTACMIVLSFLPLHSPWLGRVYAVNAVLSWYFLCNER